jgi:glycosyltransferase involved in cell wall biosynthesis
MEDIILSIIVPIYNQEKYLEECLNSIEKQMISSVEVILVDDGSTDKSKEICEDYCERNVQFKYIYKSNDGLGPARNTGIIASQGRYIMFIDSDDAIVDNAIEILIRFMIDGEFDIVYFDELICDEKLIPKFVVATLPDMDICVDSNLAMENCFNPSHIWARLYRRELFDNRVFRKMWYEDMEIFPYLISEAKRIGYFKVPIYKYRQHALSITSNDDDRRNEDVVIAWSRAKELSIRKPQYKEMLDKAIRSSLYVFIFFKPNFASTYINWYNNHLQKNSIDSEIEVKKSNALIKDSLQLVNQARVYNLNSVVSYIDALIELYNMGGQVISGVFTTMQVETEGIYLSYKQKNIVITKIALKKQSPLINLIVSELKRENIISKSNIIKYDLIDRIILKNAILAGYKIVMEV